MCEVGRSTADFTSNVFWNRPLRPWEIKEAEDLKEVIDRVDLKPGKDVLIWTHSNKEYSVKVASQCNFGTQSVSWDFIWKLKVPHKIKIFLWKLQLSILPTKVLLSTRNIIPDDGSWCPLCSTDKENIPHLFWECSYAKMVWSQMFSWWQINPIPQEEMSVMSIWSQVRQFSIKKAKVAWRVSVSATFWSIWLARNQKIFRHADIPVLSLVVYIKHLIKEWCLAFSLIHGSSVSWWNANPMGVLTSSGKFQLQELLSASEDLVGFTDGTFKDKGGKHLVGIGGTIANKAGETIFSFSGPSTANSPFEAEWQALEFLLISFINSVWNDHHIVVFSDNFKVIQKALEILTGNCKLEDNSVWDSIKRLKIRIKHIPGDLNFDADFLAKKGSRSIKLISSWAVN
ncbi:uncharacterized protein LOC108226154 [Daucus carota subsp. sativus]|uniref:uncharacterized protein LOC108226154 n=1 Tax=Daucus carota subsp. sativus TaxID=79200 RepID=UPI0007F0315C|nr:PREDICTED: uncharacterized protein LOC108226154 [Daucus carota subsp. sativus]